MPLTLMKPGECLIIRKLSGPPQVRARLQELGLVTGASVTVVGSLMGDLILQVLDSRLAIGRGLAMHIHV